MNPALCFQCPNARADGINLSEAEVAKQNAALHIVPIAAGVAALAVLLAVVILAAKKKKSGNK